MIDKLLENGLDPGSKGNEEWKKLVTTSFMPQGHLVDTPMYCNRAFSTPPSFDSQQLFEIIQLRHRAANDELIQVQTDPAYIQYVFDVASRSPPNPLFDKQNLEQQVSLAPLDSYTNYLSWSVLLEEVKRFCQVEENSQNLIRTGEPPPEEYQLALQKFQLTLGPELWDREQRVKSFNPLFKQCLVQV